MISVALCTYNGEQFIEEQLYSILNQSTKVDEVVICDDGSSDGTIFKIKQISLKTQVPIYVHINETNLGCVLNFEKAISLCRGDIILLSDQDDVWMHDKVKTIVKWFSEHPEKDVVISDAVLIDKNRELLTQETYFSLYFDDYSRLQFDNGFGLELFIYRNRACGATMAFRRSIKDILTKFVHNNEYSSVFKKCIQSGIIHDYIIALFAISEKKMGYIDKVLTYYRQHENQVCGVGTIKKICGDEPFKIDYQKDDTLLFFPFNLETKKRVEFIFWRSKLKRNLIAPILVILKSCYYTKYFGMMKNKVMLYDIKESMQNNLSRIKNKLKIMFTPKVKKIFISYGDEKFKKNLIRIRREASRLGIFDRIKIYTETDLPIEITSSPLMQYERGGGHWLWKPYLIYNTLKLYPNAIVVYADAGCTLNNNIQEWNTLFELMKENNTILTYYQPTVDYGWQEIFGTSSVTNSTWIKRETIEFFDKQFESKEWHNYPSVWAGFIIAKNESHFIKLVLDTMMTYPNLVVDPIGVELPKQFENFRGHRSDQSIMSALAYLYIERGGRGLKLIPETGESSLKAAVVASRIKDKDILSVWSRVVLFFKSVMGETLYKKMHFWK